MKLKSFLVLGLFLINGAFNLQAQTEKPIVDDKLIFEEKEGIVAVEAGFFINKHLQKSVSGTLSVKENCHR